MQKKAYSYIRFSTPQQLKGDSLRRQLEASRAYAEAHDMVLDDSLRDIGISAFKGKHATEGVLKKFIELVDALISQTNEYQDTFVTPCVLCVAGRADGSE